MTGEKINGINSALPQAEPAVDPSKHLRIPGIDGLRAFACLLVLIQHANGTFPFPSETAWWLVSWFANGILGVSIFFVISGFLITHLLRKEWESTGRIHLGAFYVRRSLRIFPVFYSFIAVLVVLRTQGLIHTRWEHLLISGIYLTNYRQCFTALGGVSDRRLAGDKYCRSWCGRDGADAAQ